VLLAFVAMNLFTPTARPRATLFLAERYLPVMSGSRLYHHEVAKRLENVVVVTRHERGGEEAFDERLGFKIIRGWGIGRTFFPSLPRHPALSFVTEYLPGAGSMLFWSLVAAVRFRPATIHTGDGLFAGLAARLVSRVCGAPYVVYAHGEDLAGFTRRNERYNDIMRAVFTKAHAVVCNTRNTADLAVRFGVAPARIVVAYPGVDTERFDADGPGAEPARRGPVLLSVGFLIKQKGHEIAVRALPSLVNEFPDLRYVVVGDGPERGRLERLAGELGVTANVTFLGRVPEPELLAAYRAADVYVQPSLVVEGVTEGYGISFVEAGAAGLPVVGGRCGGVVEAVVDGVTGLLVTPGDAADFARAVSALLRDDDLRRRMGDAGRRLARERTWDKTLVPVIALDRTLRSAERRA
jgi:phosphatidylinositol alpha-1,6-mannosyltransferase